MSMRNKFGHLVGDVFELKVNHYGRKGDLVVLVKDDETDTPLFEVIKSDSTYSIGSRFWIEYDKLTPVYTQEGEDYVEPYSPFTMTFTDIESFEVMKAIMHLHNKVADSSYFNLDFTPDSETVREFMKQIKSDMDTHHAGWSKYVAKGE